MWVVLALLSAILLGVYDILKKVSLRGNAVLPVLLSASVTGTLIFLPPVILSYLHPESAYRHFGMCRPSIGIRTG